MNRSSCLCLVILLGTLPLLAQDDVAAARTAAGCGPRAEMFNVQTTDLKHPVGQTEPGKALVYFFVDFVGNTMRVGVDGKWVGATHDRSYFFVQLDPGEHDVCLLGSSRLPIGASESDRPGEAMHLKMDAGKTYYVRLSFLCQRMHLELSDEAEGHFLIASSRFATSQPKKE